MYEEALEYEDDFSEIEIWSEFRFDTPEEGLASLMSALGDSMPALDYTIARIPKRSGGMRELNIPNPRLKQVQRSILVKLLGGIPCHPSAMGFRTGRSIVDNAKIHSNKKIILKMDIKDFFQSTDADRVRELFSGLGWDQDAADLLTEICTHGGGLPQGAPTSPCVSNLVNFWMDARLNGIAGRSGGHYSRYADDMTFSFKSDNPKIINHVRYLAGAVVRGYGYAINPAKTSVIRSHQQQRVTGLVVNEKARLPRARRRFLRAVEHHLATRRPITLSEAELQGWRSFSRMVEQQST